jgi:lycopene beta-cyclase
LKRETRENYIKIGTGGGWVKPSTGYSFRNSQRYVEKILANLRSGKPPAKKLISRRHRFLDTVFIKVLRDDNASGEQLFEKMYSGLPTRTVFRFLDEQSTAAEDFSIMLLYPNLKFIGSFFSAVKAKVF